MHFCTTSVTSKVYFDLTEFESPPQKKKKKKKEGFFFFYIVSISPKKFTFLLDYDLTLEWLHLQYMAPFPPKRDITAGNIEECSSFPGKFSLQI